MSAKENADENENLLMDEIYREKVIRARAQDPCEKLLDGFRLFESSLAFTKAGVAAMLETDNEQEIMRGVFERFKRVRKVREAGLYKTKHDA